MADATGFPTAPSVLGSMAAAATVEEILRSTVGEQTHTLRGSLASQSLAADLANQVFKTMEGENIETAISEAAEGAGAGLLGDIGGETLKVLAVQSAAAVVPAILKSLVNACQKRTPT